MLLNLVVSQTVSYVSCGMRTGWDEGHAGALVKPSWVMVLYMWDWWSGLSRFLPSQHLVVTVSHEYSSISAVNGLYSRGEVVDCEDTAGAWLGGEVDHLGASVDGGLQAVVAQTDVGLGLGKTVRAGLADCHTETLLKEKRQNLPINKRCSFWKDLLLGRL
jgi:hypothetical protein